MCAGELSGCLCYQDIVWENLVKQMDGVEEASWGGGSHSTLCLFVHPVEPHHTRFPTLLAGWHDNIDLLYIEVL